jgi:hypothetical protein
MDRLPKVGDILVAFLPDSIPIIPMKMLILSQPRPAEKGICGLGEPTHKMKIYGFLQNETGYYWFNPSTLKNHITLLAEAE